MDAINESMKIYPSKDAKNQFGALLDDAQREPVQLTKNGRRIGGVVNQSLFEKVIELEHKEAQRKTLDTLKALQQESVTKPKPTREALQALLDCDAEEIKELFGDEFFDQ